MAGAHAILSPSSSHVWGGEEGCRAAPAMQLGRPDTSGDDAKQGTCMHEVMELCINEKKPACAFVGQTFTCDDYSHTVTKEDADALQSGCLDPLMILAEGKTLYAERRLSIEHITGEEGGKGTSDSVILSPNEICIADLKWGMGVQVYAKDNEQLAMYALGALEEYGLVYDFKTVRMVIFQPRLNWVDEWVITVDELITIGERLKVNAKVALELVEMVSFDGISAIDDEFFNPSESNCRFCKAKGECKSQAQFVVNTVIGDFTDISDENLDDSLSNAVSNAKLLTTEEIGKLMQHVGLIEMFCKAVVARGEAIAHAGGKVPGFKMVQGKNGNRKWFDMAEAESMLKSMRLKHEEMYDYSLISPTTAEKLLKKESPRRWTRLQSVITQTEGRPTLVPESDKRPEIAVTPVEDDFADVSNDLDDLL